VGVPRPPHAHKTDVAFTSVLGVVVSLKAYLSLESFQDPLTIRLPSHVICVSLRRHTERSGLAAALHFLRELARGTADTGARPFSALAPRDVGCAVLGRLRDGVCGATLWFAVEASGVHRGGGRLCGGRCGVGRYVFFAGCAELLLQGNGYGEDRRSSEVSCIVVTDGGGRDGGGRNVCDLVREHGCGPCLAG
jgi:hypothetical protein